MKTLTRYAMSIFFGVVTYSALVLENPEAGAALRTIVIFILAMTMVVCMSEIREPPLREDPPKPVKWTSYIYDIVLLGALMYYGWFWVGAGYSLSLFLLWRVNTHRLAAWRAWKVREARHDGWR